MRIYVASSWRNPHQPWMVSRLRAYGHDVYDFRHTEDNGSAFSWDQIDPNWELWDIGDFQSALTHTLSEAAFASDHYHLSEWADAGIMVMPCGASSHLEIGYMAGLGKPCAIYITEGRPELMYKEVDLISDSLFEILDWISSLKIKE